MTETEVPTNDELREKATQSQLDVLHKHRKQTLEKTDDETVADMVFEINLHAMKAATSKAEGVASEYSTTLFDEVDRKVNTLVDPGGFSEKQAECMALKDIGLTNAGIAAVTSMTKSTVETHLRRAQRKVTEAQFMLDTLDDLGVGF
jgi:DNA-binding CsgD family transcriptional regulator